MIYFEKIGFFYLVGRLVGSRFGNFRFILGLLDLKVIFVIFFVFIFIFLRDLGILVLGGRGVFVLM